MHGATSILDGLVDSQITSILDVCVQLTSRLFYDKNKNRHSKMLYDVGRHWQHSKHPKKTLKHSPRCNPSPSWPTAPPPPPWVFPGIDSWAPNSAAPSSCQLWWPWKPFSCWSPWSTPPAPLLPSSQAVVVGQFSTFVSVQDQHTESSLPHLSRSELFSHRPTWFLWAFLLAVF